MKKKVFKVIIVVAAVLCVEWIFIGYRYNFGPFKKLGDIRMGKLAGNGSEYSVENIEKAENSTLAGKKVCFLRSSVTYGAASLREGIPEYFAQRFGWEVTKEAVSGTTLTDTGKNSYVQRLTNNIDAGENYDLLICQLSTNDASKELSLGEISESQSLADFDTGTITGAIEYIICYAQEELGCPVVFYTSAKYDSENYEAMVRRLYELQSKWDITILNLWDDESFNDISDEERALYMYDDIHPTRAGYFMWWRPEMERQLNNQIAS